MPNLADLTLGLESLGLAEKQIDYHELHIEYPGLDLLPSGEVATPYLRQPLDQGVRERPDISNFHLQTSGTNFSVRLALTRVSSPPFSPLELKRVFAKTDGLSHTPGRSLLQAVSYVNPEYGVYHRFRLSTQYDGEYEIIAENELSDLEWEAERAGLRSKTWMELIANLINRASDYA